MLNRYRLFVLPISRIGPGTLSPSAATTRRPRGSARRGLTLPHLPRQHDVVRVLPDALRHLRRDGKRLRGLADGLRDLSASPGGRRLVESAIRLFGNPESNADPDVTAPRAADASDSATANAKANVTTTPVQPKRRMRCLLRCARRPPRGRDPRRPRRAHRCGNRDARRTSACNKGSPANRRPCRYHS